MLQTPQVVVGISKNLVITNKMNGLIFQLTFTFSFSSDWFSISLLLKHEPECTDGGIPVYFNQSSNGQKIKNEYILYQFKRKDFKSFSRLHFLSTLELAELCFLQVEENC